MADLDERLRRGVAAVAEAERPGSTPEEVLVALEHRLPVPSTVDRRRRVLVAVAALTVLVLVGALALVRSGGRSGGGRVVVGPPPTTAPGPFPAGLHDWGSGPLAGSFNPTPIWDGRQVVVLGGDLTSSDPSSADRVASLDPATGGWRTLPSLPFLPGPPEEQFVSGTACGDVVFAWDLDGQFAELAPGSPAWTSLPPAPDSASDALGQPAYCTADGILFPADGKAFTFATRSWRTLAPDPRSEGSIGAVAWTGHEVVVVGTSTASSSTGRTSVYDPSTDAWRPAAPSPLEAFGPALAWTGARIVETNALGHAASYDPSTDRWSTLPDLPTSVVTPGATSSALVVLDGTAFVVDAHGAARLGADDRWAVVPTSIELGWSAIAGQALLSWAAGAHGRGLQSYVPG